ncbi:hypothetical protein SAY86_028240 [Trapa natans]|uniref:Amino acid transporter transmembrane domain-containing protein n=1 Tax=Trapa natans TaxID=22666 RepID=A0AAN7M1X5_TRANT|nr:hypothetical protein SAY86_028240 [Trapa natans]
MDDCRRVSSSSIFLEQGIPTSIDNQVSDRDDDGCIKRTGTLMTASAHIITAVIGSGVLSMAWAVAQLGWVAGPVVLLAFSFITNLTSALLTDCYRSPDPITGKRNYTYMEVPGIQHSVHGDIGLHRDRALPDPKLPQAIMAVRLRRGNVLRLLLHWYRPLHRQGCGGSPCCKDYFDGVTVGVDVTEMDKVGRTFQAIGKIAFAYSYSVVLDTLKSDPPENKVMKKASRIAVTTTTFSYMICGCVGYAAFGNGAHGNFLTGFGFYEPFWLIDFANTCIVIHLIGAYQVIYLGTYSFNMFRFTWRTVYVIITTLVAMIFPFFNDILGMIGAFSLWPLTVFFPVEMYIARTNMKKYSFTWTWMKILSLSCLVVSLVALISSVQGLVKSISSR